MILDPERELCLRPMKYPQFYSLYKDAIANIWTVDELDFSVDYEHLRDKITPEEAHLIKRLVAFFASADALVSENLVLNLYQRVNSPEYRLYLSQQLAEEALHVDTYLLLLDTYLATDGDKTEAFDAYKTVPSIKKKADFMLKYMENLKDFDTKTTINNIICFAACVEGLFFFGSFAYVYFLRSKGLLPGLATATDWVFRQETMHIEAAMQVVDIIKKEYPEEFTPDLEAKIRTMMQEALDAEIEFCNDALGEGITGISSSQMAEYLKYIADARLVRLGYKKMFNAHCPFDFMILQDIQPLTNFFERKVTQYQVGIQGTISFDEEF